MALILTKLDKLKPYKCYQSIFDIDYDDLLSSGKSVIFFDIDNTIGSYADDVPCKETIQLFSDLKAKGLLIYLWSNSPLARVRRYGEALGLPYLSKANKPFLGKIRKFILANEIDLTSAICVGDQIMTDCILASKLGLQCILVAPIDKSSEKWYTRLNRIIIKIRLRWLKKKDPNTYEEIRRIQWKK